MSSNITNWKNIALSETGLAQLKLDFKSKSDGLKDILDVYKIWVKKSNSESNIIQTRVLYKYLDKLDNKIIWNGHFAFYLNSKSWSYYYNSGNEALLENHELRDDNYELVYKNAKVFPTESSTKKPIVTETKEIAVATENKKKLINTKSKKKINYFWYIIVLIILLLIIIYKYII